MKFSLNTEIRLFGVKLAVSLREIIHTNLLVKKILNKQNKKF